MKMKKGEHRRSNIERRTPKGMESGWALRECEAGGRKFNLENRLLEFASAVIDLSEKLPSSRAGNPIAGQLLRSGSSPYPNHGEAESAESRDNFVHKFKIRLTELRETRRWARPIERKCWKKNDTTLSFVLSESEELNCIFMPGIKTARQNALRQKRAPDPIRYPSVGAG
ncbi:MAG: four helix bundle protein [Verrucomicrobiota bacterium]|nr:four helix bundle protein [Verrucomicrobiota bacterium]